MDVTAAALWCLPKAVSSTNLLTLGRLNAWQTDWNKYLARPPKCKRGHDRSSSSLRISDFCLAGERGGGGAVRVCLCLPVLAGWRGFPCVIGHAASCCTCPLTCCASTGCAQTKC